MTPEKEEVMKYILAPLVALVATTVVTPEAQAKPGRDRADCPRKLERTYSKGWHKVRRVHGKRAPGRNIRRHGVRFRGTTFDATCGELRRSRRQLDRLLLPQPYSGLRTTAVPPAQPPAGVRTPGVDGAYGGWAIDPAIVMCESGGDYGAVNPSSGARGAYQILPSTHASICPDLGWDPAGQDQCAARIMAQQGRGAWVC
jgi:Transglycosylase-like domain